MQYSFAVKIGDGRARRVALVPCISRACSRSVWCDDKECSRPPGFYTCGRPVHRLPFPPPVHPFQSLFVHLALVVLFTFFAVLCICHERRRLPAYPHPYVECGLR
jgi:hypothetical protein